LLSSIVLSIFPTKGFLGTGATFEADFNLAIQFMMGVALLAGSFLARRKRYRAHGICQTTVMLLNLGMIAIVMWPSFQQQVRPAIPRIFHKWYFAAAAGHALLGSVAELFGLYIVIAAGTRVLPSSLRFNAWKRWMRAELLLWWIVVLSGVGTYCAWYIAPFR